MLSDEVQMLLVLSRWHNALGFDWVWLSFAIRSVGSGLCLVCTMWNILIRVFGGVCLRVGIGSGFQSPGFRLVLD
jgi:hypothetical protein